MERALAFRPFGADHVAVLAATALAAILLLCGRRRVRAWRDDRWLRRGLACGVGGGELVSWAVGLAQGRFVWPLQLCDAALWVAVAALWDPRPWRCELAYFWGSAGSLQALLTPDLREPFPNFWWWVFFGDHVGALLVAIYLAATGRLAPTARSVWRVWAVTNGYALLAGLVNWWAGTNFGYLARKPLQPSLLDFLGPWPWYIVGMEGIALGSLWLFAAPWLLAKRRAVS